MFLVYFFLSTYESVSVPDMSSKYFHVQIFIILSNNAIFEFPSGKSFILWGIFHGDYDNTGCGVLKGGYKIRKIFA